MKRLILIFLTAMVLLTACGTTGNPAGDVITESKEHAEVTGSSESEPVAEEVSTDIDSKSDEDPHEEIENIVAEGYELIAKGDYSAAEEAFSNALAEDAENVDGVLGIIELDIRQNRFPEALDYAKEVYESIKDDRIKEKKEMLESDTIKDSDGQIRKWAVYDEANSLQFYAVYDYRIDEDGVQRRDKVTTYWPDGTEWRYGYYRVSEDGLRELTAGVRQDGVVTYSELLYEKAGDPYPYMELRYETGTWLNEYIYPTYYDDGNLRSMTQYDYMGHLYFSYYFFYNNSVKEKEELDGIDYERIQVSTDPYAASNSFYVYFRGVIDGEFFTGDCSISEDGIIDSKWLSSDSIDPARIAEMISLEKAKESCGYDESIIETPASIDENVPEQELDLKQYFTDEEISVYWPS